MYVRDVQGEEEKRTEAMLSYKAWEEQKKEKLAKEKTRQHREEEKKKEKEREDIENKRVEAEVVSERTSRTSGWRPKW